MGTSKVIREGQEFLTFEFFIDELELISTQKTGSITFTLGHSHDNWLTNNSSYIFKPISTEGIFVQSFKDPDGTFRISINGPLGHSLTIRHDISKFSTPKLNIALTWENKSIKLYLNGKLAKEKHVKE